MHGGALNDGDRVHSLRGALGCALGDCAQVNLKVRLETVLVSWLGRCISACRELRLRLGATSRWQEYKQRKLNMCSQRAGRELPRDGVRSFPRDSQSGGQFRLARELVESWSMTVPGSLLVSILHVPKRFPPSFPWFVELMTKEFKRWLKRIQTMQ